MPSNTHSYLHVFPKTSPVWLAGVVIQMIGQHLYSRLIEHIGCPTRVEYPLIVPVLPETPSKVHRFGATVLEPARSRLDLIGQQILQINIQTGQEQTKSEQN